MASLLQPQPLQHPLHPTHLQGLPSPGGRSPQSSINTFNSGSSPASFASSGQPLGSPQPRNIISKSGWLEKYSVGRGFLPVRNWRRRWVNVSHSGLNYSTGPSQEPHARTFVPFVDAGARGGDTPTKHQRRESGVKLRPVFLYSSVTSSIHSEACDPHMYYFGLRFEEDQTPRILLLRTTDQSERDAWVRFIGQFVHAASAGMPFSSHPVAAKKNPKPDPEELDPQSQAQLRRSVLAWDDGFQHRVAGFEAPTENVHAVNWESDEEPIADDGEHHATSSALDGSGRLERRKSENSRCEGASSRPPAPGDDDTL